MSDERTLELDELPFNFGDFSDASIADERRNLERDLGPSSLWEGLLAGHFSLIEQFERDGRTYLVARRNEMRGPELTPREREAAVLVARSLSNEQIADRMGISLAAVAAHIANAAQKMGIASREALIDAAEAFSGQIDPLHR